jgi:predicted ATP-grasp superfamily ATP-dependent carboligase
VKVLVFEYITGGGFNKQQMPDALAREGRLMLKALLDNLTALHDIELLLMVDERFSGVAMTGNINTVIIESHHHTLAEFERAARQCDAVWPIAPEFDGILQALCRHVELLGKLLLTSPAAAVAITGDKFKTYEHLASHNIATVSTRRFEHGAFVPGEWIVKPVDGVGCAGNRVISSQDDFAALSAQLRDKARYIIQPHMHGKKTSMSCLFKQGKAWLLCVNLQRFNFVDKQYHLVECVVNHQPDFSPYLDLLATIASAFPDMWGYAGIDLIETAEQILVLEINPRLTTSFAGIDAALGVNVAEMVLQLLQGEPDINPLRNQAITINVQDVHEI